MRGVIVPPSKLIVTRQISPKGRFLIREGVLINKGGDYIYIYIYIYIHSIIETYQFVV